MRKIKRRHFLAACGVGATGVAPLASAADGQPIRSQRPANGRRTFVSQRQDGRYVGTTGFVHAYCRQLRPRLGFDRRLKADDFPTWRRAVRSQLHALMCLPDLPPQPAPRHLWTAPRDGYRLEKWEAYPEPHSVVPFLLLIPAGASQQAPAPAVLCLPGSGSSKESLAGEAECDGHQPNDLTWRRNRMALFCVRQGIVALAADNPAMGETADANCSSPDLLAINSIWVGRHYEGISVFQKRGLLRWLETQPWVDPQRIAVCGHSLGAKPALILGLLEPMVRAVVWNDAIVNWRRRAVATNLLEIGLCQYVPALLEWFDYPDLMAALAPKPLLVTEGGRTRDIEHVRSAYRLLGAERQIRVVHYPKYATADLRPLDQIELPEGLTMGEYYRYANVDPEAHYFKADLAVPWLAQVLHAGDPH